MLNLLKTRDFFGHGFRSRMPCIADPGYLLVSKRIRQVFRYYPYPGPNSILMALMASGFSGQEFHFHGYLPAKKEEFAKQINLDFK